MRVIKPACKKLIVMVVSFILFESASAQEYPVIFTSQKKGGNDELVIRYNEKQVQLTYHSAKDSSPHLSPDGRNIVFTSERVGWWKIWSYDLQTGKTTQLTKGRAADYSPMYSPAGKEIIFTSGRGGKSDLYIMNLDGSEVRNLTNSSASEGAAYWAKDGFIYYSANETGRYQLMRIKPDGTGKEHLSDGTADDLDPELSPDGKQLVYYSYKFGNPEICVMSLDTKEVIRLTNNPLLDIRPSWAPNGESIVFERGNKKDNQQIFIINRDGSGEKQLTFSGYNYAPVFMNNLGDMSRIKTEK
ncbi:DPP IV N-terminal domain-containing protein [Roseivirga sp. 4D4]|uniref:DPP IV N-terminal domain-containing protein n=1 Tax=Roseivirga sp. 4D4 TaxID=1889784 RepID=UPI00147A5223|nr:DPP IV N-terminal domain-containing protein [Roseivirga sp. 4D4]